MPETSEMALADKFQDSARTDVIVSLTFSHLSNLALGTIFCFAYPFTILLGDRAQEPPYFGVRDGPAESGGEDRKRGGDH